MALIIDTSVFITIERKGWAMDSLGPIAADGPVGLSAISASELLLGVQRADSPPRRVRREAFVSAIFDEIPIFAFDLRAARVHANIWAHLVANGHTIGSHDLLIAATALSHGYAVLTDNVREFHRVPGLEVRQPNW